jgi:hypothetical protein
MEFSKTLNRKTQTLVMHTVHADLVLVEIDSVERALNFKSGNQSS